MVVKADGTKWACQSCLKGHRVSGCTHTDRELILVPKKGRPVTQCQHCRSERKKRSAHVSCECGEGSDKPHHSKEKCVHLREAEERAKAGNHEECTNDKKHLAAVAEEQGCCCPHGGKCVCALRKKESDGEGSVTPPRGPAVKPRLETAKSDGSMTVFQNGHHKPVHRKNHLAHECGMPYKMPMSRAKTDQGISTKARRSVDSLALDNTMMLNPSAFTPQTSAPFNTERRMSKSEQHSPRIYPSDQLCSGGLMQADLGAIDFVNLGPVQTNHSMQSVSTDAFNFASIEPLSALTESTFDPWSAMPSAEIMGMPDNNPFGVWPTNPDVGGVAQPALTAASSGTQSEIDESPHVDESLMFGMPSIQEDSGTFQFDGNNGLPNSPNQNRRSLPANFFKGINSVSEWPFDFSNNTVSHSQQNFDADQMTALDDSWEGTNLPPVADVPRRQMHGLPTHGRPTSRSVGLGSAPSEDILKSLFPEMGLDANYFDSMNMSQDYSMNDNIAAIGSVHAASQVDFGPMNEEVSFTAQPWSDGSMSIPHENFTSSYDLNQDFSNPDFSGNWSQ